VRPSSPGSCSGPSILNSVTHLIRCAANVNHDLPVTNEVMAKDSGLCLVSYQVFELAKSRGLDLDVCHDGEAFFVMMTRVGNNIGISHVTDL
jgi:hypothetical protein